MQLERGRSHGDIESGARANYSDALGGEVITKGSPNGVDVLSSLAQPQ